jgi:hypothetical protein
MLDIFVPTCARDLPQARLLLHSLDRFLEPGVVTSINLASIDAAAVFEHVTDLRSARFQPCVRYLRAGDLGILSGGDNGAGWLRQQAAKLLFARRARTEFYMVLDSKNIALNPVSPRDLVRDGRAAWVLEPMSPRKAKWWRGSAWALAHAKFVRSDGRIAVSSATPFLFHTASVVAMIDWLERRHGEPLQTFLEKRRPLRGRFMTPTEFTLYYVYMDREQLSARYHFASGDLHDVASQVWNAGTTETRAARIRRILSPEASGLFTGIHHGVWERLTDRERAALYGRVNP